MPPASAAGNARIQAPQNPPVVRRPIVDFFLRTWLGNVLTVIGLLFTILGVAWTIYTGVLSLRYGATQTCAALYSIGKYTGYCNKTLEAGVTPAPAIRRDTVIQWNVIAPWEQASTWYHYSNTRALREPREQASTRYHHSTTRALSNCMKAAEIGLIEVTAYTSKASTKVSNGIVYATGVLEIHNILSNAFFIGIPVVMTWLVWVVLKWTTALKRHEMLGICAPLWAVVVMLLGNVSQVQDMWLQIGGR
ncbi:hypothetical protein LTR56_015162 [Elasticomyces elasticus]|nr:hypothetical protein LTR56_015162 [Elasticomyces elasticus]KAK3644456.1 hypothetical protein LTR22_015176 [Elasticomyces elasticus]KAK4915492.1 hypothetical protein LTR49_016339 [Elasticomyces elasticus]KAK5756210.1 hypothetical protein LTS12_013634 [Elasticomyces elasticus]